MVVLALLFLPRGAAQDPSVPWRTVHTEHYRIHFPVEATAWATQVSSRLETVRDRVVAEVGWAPDRIVDVVIVDPFGAANGMAVPLTGSPRMQLWATPPDPDSVIGHHRGWGELLTVHEDAHLVHLMRDARNPAERALQAITGAGPIARKSPRWVTEGYATVVEGRLTGAGRPNGDLRAVLLRRLAQGGALPSYGELSGSTRWMGFSMAYLAGSAYLEWLEAHHGPGTLADLWARMSARRTRSFEEAFEGVFGDSPSAHYGRFVAEMTSAAMASTPLPETLDDTLFQKIGWTTGPPAVSPSGAAVAVPITRREGPSLLRLYATADDTDAITRRQERIDATLAADPDDVAPVAPRHPPHEVMQKRVFWGRTARHPRWLPDGRLLFDAWGPDPTGRRRPDLYVWDPQSGNEERITRWADVHSPDPSPDGTWAVAVRSAWGATQLVRVDLDPPSAGDPWGELTPMSVDTTVARPRISGDGRHLAWLSNAGEGWEIAILDIETGERMPSGPAFGLDGLAPRNLVWGPAAPEEIAATVPPGEDARAPPSGEDTGASETTDALDAPPAVDPPATEGDDATEDDDAEAHRLAPPVAGDGSTLGPSLYAEIGSGGRIEIHEIWRGGQWVDRRMSLTSGGALAPDVTDDDQIFFLSMRPGGLDLHRTPLVPAPGTPPVVALAGRTPYVAGPPHPEADPIEVEGYRLGRIGLFPLLGGALGSPGRQLEIGIHATDLVGRTSFLAVGSFADAGLGTTGGRLALTYRGLPIDLQLTGYAASDPRYAIRRGGGLLQGQIDHRFAIGRIGARIGGLVETPLSDVDAIGGRRLAFGETTLGFADTRRGLWGVSFRARGQTGQTDVDPVQLLAGRVAGRLFRGPSLLASYDIGLANGNTPLDRFQLGGAASSVIPDAATWSWIDEPASAARVSGGLLADRTEISLDLDSAEPFVVRHHVDDDLEGATTFLGIRSAAMIPRSDFFRIPSGAFDVGVACRIEDPVAGFDRRPCQSWNDFGAWAVVTWSRR